MIHNGGSSDPETSSLAEILVEESADALIALSEDGVILHWNRGAERIFGFPSAVAVGQPLHALTVPAERRGEVRAAIDQAMRTGSAAFEAVRQRADGSEIVVDTSMRAVRDAHGRLRFIAITETDVSALTRLLGACAAETRFRGLLEAAPDAMVIVGEAGTIVLVNSQTERLFGYPRDELLGKPIELLVPERFRSHHPEHRAAYFRESQARPMGAELELFGRRKDGSEFPAEISLAPMEAEEGRLVTAAIRDTSARRVSERALKVANRELEAFSYSVAHDLRAPLRGMNGFAQLLLDEYYDKLDAEGQDWLVEILSNARRMGGLIDDLLSLSRVARVELRRERIDLSAIARASATQIATAERHRAVDVVIADRLIADADPDLVRTILDNLLANAWKFTAKVAHPRIEIGVTEHRADRPFFVRDNGAGFDMAFANKLFVPFQRLHTVTEFAGTGIGLASVQRILHRHGGEIWAEGRVDEGATFYFTFHGRTTGVES